MANKQKTRKAVAKRFKVTKNGKVLHRGHGVRHLRTRKSNKRLRAQAIPKKVEGKVKKKVLQMLGK